MPWGSAAKVPDQFLCTIADPVHQSTAVLLACASVRTGSSFCTLVTPLVARSVWNTVSRPPRTASLRASQMTSVAVVSVTCAQRLVQHRLDFSMLDFHDRCLACCRCSCRGSAFSTAMLISESSCQAAPSCSSAAGCWGHTTSDLASLQGRKERKEITSRNRDASSAPMTRCRPRKISGL